MEKLKKIITIATVREENRDWIMQNYIERTAEHAMGILEEFEVRKDLNEIETIVLKEARVILDILATADSLLWTTVDENVKKTLVDKYVK